MNNNNALPLLMYIILEEYERRNYMRLDRRQLRDSRNPFEMPDCQFKNMFRLPKHLIIWLINVLAPHDENNERSTRLPLYLKTLITITFLSRGSYQHSVGGSCWHSVSQSSVSRSIKQICKLITDVLMPEWVQFPTTNIALSAVKAGFYEKFGFRGVLGAIDGTHVNIIAPPATDEEHPPHIYINRKQDYSINVMLIYDANTRILACDARYPGSVHDSAIYRMSDIRAYLENRYENGDTTSHLIGDSGYPLEPWLFTPFQVVQDGTPEAEFNIMLKSTRNTIERTNGILKGRFRALLKHRVLHYHPSKAAYIIYSCVILHNLALSANVELDEQLLEYDDEDIDNNHNPNLLDNNAGVLQLGREARNNYIRENIIN